MLTSYHAYILLIEMNLNEQMREEKKQIVIIERNLFLELERHRS